MTLSPRRQTALIAVILFFALGFLAIGASPLSARSLEQRLQAAAEEALRGVDADRWATVSLSGQVATLSGLAPDRQAQAQALDAVSSASWAGGVVAGGITRVLDQTRQAREEAPVQFSAEKAAGRVQISGLAPDAATVDRIEALARRLFAGGADVQMQLAPGSAPDGFEVTVQLVLSELTRLDSGAARISRERYVLTGLAPDSATAIRARQAIARGVESFQGAALIRTDAGDFGVEINDPVHCRLLVEAAQGSRPVSFSPGGAGLTSGSTANLRRAGAAFDACNAGSLIVAVRAEGADTSDEVLALARAEAVIEAMSAAGPARELFLAESAPQDADRALRFALAPAPVEPTEPEQTEE
ncbi:BON domain-containing protein [Maricaulaceae bacterium EIL42A08]|nr:BON domain-containing protein [Maricaulaceae bacterium EIL42A08]